MEIYLPAILLAPVLLLLHFQYGVAQLACSNTVTVTSRQGQENAILITDRLTGDDTCYIIVPAKPDQIVYFNFIQFKLPLTERNPSARSSIDEEDDEENERRRKRSIQQYLCSRAMVAYTIRDDTTGNVITSNPFCGFSRPIDLGRRHIGDPLMIIVKRYDDLGPDHDYGFTLEHWSQSEVVPRDPCYDRSEGAPTHPSWPPILYAHEDIRTFTVPVGSVTQQDNPTVNAEKDCSWVIKSVQDHKNIRIALIRDRDPELNLIKLHLPGGLDEMLNNSFSDYRDMRHDKFRVHWSPDNPRNPRWTNQHGTVSTGFTMTYTIARIACMASTRPVHHTLTVTNVGGALEHQEVTIRCPDDYGHDGALYGNDQHCSWQVDLDDKTGMACLAYEFGSDFDIESGYDNQCEPYDCLHDSVTVQVAERKDEITKNSPYHGTTYWQTFCGTRAPPAVTVDGKSLKVTFKSDGQNQRRGFKVRVFTVVCKPKRCRDEWEMLYQDFCVSDPPHQKFINGHDSHFDQTPTYLAESIHSPCYPFHDYPSHSNCNWLVQGLPGHTLVMEFEGREYHLGETCTNDILGIAAASAGLLNFCGTGTDVNPLTYLDTRVQAGFISADNSDRGFKIRIKSVPIVKTCPSDPETIYISGPGPVTLDSSKFFGGVGYRDNVDCSWDISFPKCQSVQYALTMGGAPCEPRDKCSRDILYVNGREFCGGVRDVRGTITKSDKLKAIIRFVSDHQNTGRGFTITFMGEECRTVDYLKATPDWQCFHTPNRDLAQGTTIPTYEPATECTWIIQADSTPEFEALQMKVISMKVVGGDQHCVDDYVRVSEPSRVVGTYCSEGPAFPTPYSSDQLTVTVEFNANTDGSVDTGFEMCYRVVYKSCPVVRRTTACEEVALKRGTARWTITNPGDHVTPSSYCLWVVHTTDPKSSGFQYVLTTLADEACVSVYMIHGDVPDDDLDLADHMNVATLHVCGSDPDRLKTGTINAKTILVKLTHTDLNADFIMIVSPICGQCTQPSTYTATKAEQVLNGPWFVPSNPEQTYSIGLQCEWTIVIPRGYRTLKLSFTKMDVQSETDLCLEDHVDVFSPSSSVRAAKTLCQQAPWRLPATFSNIPAVSVKFESNLDNDVGKGFQLVYNLVPETCEPHPVIILDGCQSTTSIKSATFRDHYFNCQRCYWIFTSDKCTAYTIRPTSMRLHDDDCDDYVRVHVLENSPHTVDQMKSNPANFITGPAAAQYCGTDTTARTISASPGGQLVIIIEFKTGDLDVDAGFEIEVESSGDCCGCEHEQELTASKDIQHIKSPNYPFDYYPNQLCQYTISIPFGFLYLEIWFEKHEVSGGDATCRQDYIAVDSERYCREKAPPRTIRIPSSRRQVAVTFRSDETVNNYGFRLYYKLVPYQCPVSVQENVNGLVFVTSDNVLDHNTPSPHTYYSCIDCLWILKTKCLGFIITVERADLDPGCQDFVGVYVLPAHITPTSATDLTTNHADRLKDTFCTGDGGSVVQHVTNTVAILFHTDGKMNYRGFKLKIEPFTEGEPKMREAKVCYKDELDEWEAAGNVIRDHESVRSFSIAHSRRECLVASTCEIFIFPEKPCNEEREEGTFGYIHLWYDNDDTIRFRCDNRLKLWKKTAELEWEELPPFCGGRVEVIQLNHLSPGHTGDVIKMTYTVDYLLTDVIDCLVKFSYKVVCLDPTIFDTGCKNVTMFCPADWPNSIVGPGNLAAPRTINEDWCNLDEGQKYFRSVLLVPEDRPDVTNIEIRFIRNFDILVDSTLTDGCLNLLNDRLVVTSDNETRNYCGSWVEPGTANVVFNEPIRFWNTDYLYLDSVSRGLHDWSPGAWFIQFRCTEDVGECRESADCNQGPGRDPFTCCVDGVCVCVRGRVMVNGRCQLVEIGDPCESDVDCARLGAGAVCSAQRCACNVGHIQATNARGELYCTKVEVGTPCDAGDLLDICSLNAVDAFCDPECNLCRCAENRVMVNRQCHARSSDPRCHTCYTTGGECVDLPRVGLVCDCPGRKFSSVGNALLTGCDRGISLWGQPCDENCTCLADELQCVFSPPDRKCCACRNGYVAVPSIWAPLSSARCHEIVTRPWQCDKCIERGGTCYGAPIDGLKPLPEDCHVGCVCPRHKSTSDPNDPSTYCDTEHVTVECMKDRMIVCYRPRHHWLYPHLYQDLLDEQAVAYVRYYLQMPECRFTLKPGTTDTWCYTAVYNDLMCGIQLTHPSSMSDEYRLRGIVQRAGGKLYNIMTKDDFEFHAYCLYNNMKNVQTGGLVADLRPKGSVGQRIRAKLDFRVHDGNGLDVTHSWIFLGDPIKLVISLVDHFATYKAIRVMNCFASDKADLYSSENTCLLLQNGCPVDVLTYQTTFRHRLDDPTRSSTGIFSVFKLGETHSIFFFCSVKICIHEDDCKPVICAKNGRKRRSAQELAHTTNALKNAMHADAAAMMNPDDDDVQLVTQELRVLPKSGTRDEQPSVRHHHSSGTGHREPGHGYRERDQLRSELNELERDLAEEGAVLRAEKGRTVEMEEITDDSYDLPRSWSLIAGVCGVALVLFVISVVLVIKRRRDLLAQRNLLSASVGES